MLRTALALAMAIAALAAAAAGRTPAPLLGIVDGRLAHFDPQSLLPVPGARVGVGKGGCASRSGGTACWTVPAWAFSPDRALIAVARNEALTPSLRLVDAERLRVLADLRVGGNPVGAVAWLGRSRVLAVQELGGEQQRILAVDVANRRVVTRTALGGSLVRLDRTSRSLVMVVAPPGAIGTARLVVADASGTVRSVRLPRILAGSKLLPGATHRVESRVPGLAIDPRSRRAFVVGQGVVAELDLATLELSYHALGRTVSMRAKSSLGYSRSARWLADPVLAVSGADDRLSGTDPAGLLLIDTRDWSVREVDRGATSFVVAGDLLLARSSGEAGLSGYAFDGGKRFEVLAGEQPWVALVYRNLAYVGTSREPLQVLDLASGRIVAERRGPLPWLLLGSAFGWWDAY